MVFTKSVCCELFLIIFTPLVLKVIFCFLRSFLRTEDYLHLSPSEAVITLKVSVVKSTLNLFL